MNRLFLIFQKFKEYLNKRTLSTRLVKFYIFSVVISLALTGLRYTAFPNLTYCLNIFGEFCDAIGNIIISLVSFPGFYFANTFVLNREDVSPGNLFIIVLLTCLVFYFILGLILEKIRVRKRAKIKLTTEKVIIVIFLFLAVLLLFLLSRQ